LNIVGKDTMLQQTVARLKPLIPAERIWTVTECGTGRRRPQAGSGSRAQARAD